MEHRRKTIATGLPVGDEFQRTVIVVFCLTAWTMVLHSYLQFAWWSSQLHQSILWGWFCGFALINNSYQIFTHIFTVLQYCGIPLPIIPRGSRPKSDHIPVYISQPTGSVGLVELFFGHRYRSLVCEFFGSRPQQCGDRCMGLARGFSETLHRVHTRWQDLLVPQDWVCGIGCHRKNNGGLAHNHHDVIKSSFFLRKRNPIY